MHCKLKLETKELYESHFEVCELYQKGEIIEIQDEDSDAESVSDND